MSTLTESPILAPVPTVSGPPADADAKLERILRLLEEQEQRRADLAEALTDLMPMANGLARLAIARLDALEKEGTLADARRIGGQAPALVALAARAAEALSRPAEPVRPLRLLRALREPEVARGMGVALALLRALGAGPSTDNTNPAPAAG